MNAERKRQWAKVIVWSLCLSLWGGLGPIACAGGPMSEYQVKALCLYNFAKYVEWPPTVFSETTAPLVIGVVGNDDMADILKAAVKGKAIDGHPIAVQALKPGEDAHKCHILFVSSTESKRLGEILSSIKASPVLTVGEGLPFQQAGGIICLLLRSEKVRFEIDLAAANQARLQISSKLLSLADAVRGKPQ